MSHKKLGLLASAAILAFSSTLLIGACGSDDEPPPPTNTGGSTGRGTEQAGQACNAPSDCYSDIDTAQLKGDPYCLDRVEDGYCTHHCTTDSDCCAVEGECKTDLAQVCAPFESTGLMLCFLSCEDGDLAAARGTWTYPDGADEATEYCRHWAGTEFICRSTGGGSANRKVCSPGGGNCNNLAYRDTTCGDCLKDQCCGYGAACDADANCSALTSCLRNCPNGDQGCVDACYAQYPGSRSVYDGLLGCMNSFCANACPYPYL